MGDLDFDGAAKISDLVALCKHVVGVVGANLTGTALANADCNNDGVVDSTDALTLAKYIVKKIASLPYTD
ncbi:MAG: dockerin type I repeat-containing protein [Ruminococcus sp.]|nr:dockerin type I repeat-containing protein [Ruminococcus sp.]